MDPATCFSDKSPSSGRCQYKRICYANTSSGVYEWMQAQCTKWIMLHLSYPWLS